MSVAPGKAQKIMPNKKGLSQKTIFGGVIAVILLGLYVYTVIVALAVTSCLAKGDECTSLTKDSFTSGMSTTLAMVGGLVSALVIAELAITKPGEVPVARALDENPTAQSETILKITTSLYLLIWIIFGLLAFIIGFLQYPGFLQPLTDLGQSWFGLAVAAAYAYLGINQQAG